MMEKKIAIGVAIALLGSVLAANSYGDTTSPITYDACVTSCYTDYCGCNRSNKVCGNTKNSCVANCKTSHCPTITPLACSS